MPEVFVLDSSSEAEAEEEETEAEIQHSGPRLSQRDIVSVPFKLQNPVTMETTVMRVGPIMDFELAPTMEGLDLQLYEGLQRRRQQSKTENLPQEAALPLIGNVYSTAIQHTDESSDVVVDLCDSDWNAFSYI